MGRGNRVQPAGGAPFHGVSHVARPATLGLRDPGGSSLLRRIRVAGSGIGAPNANNTPNMRSAAHSMAHPPAGFLPWIALAALAGGACAPPQPPSPPWLELVQVRPEDRNGLFLNEELVLHFSAPVDLTSVTRDSVRVLGPAGDAAAGTLVVEGERVRFVPEPPLSPDLSDGGLHPATAYTVEVIGFPYPAGVRSVDGAPLSATWRFGFRTVEVRGLETPAFADDSPGVAAPLVPASRTVRPDEPIVLDAGEPLDPRSLRSEDFLLEKPDGRAVRVAARLVENHDPHALPSRGGTRLELLPERPLRTGRYVLRQRPGLVDFGGNPVPVAVRGGIELFVAGADLREVFVEGFLGTTRRSSRAVAGADGTAYWGGDGLVTIRWPAAAGDGRRGEVSLKGEVVEADIAATRLEVPSAASARLPETGLVVLRSQGRLRVAGLLERRSAAGPPMRFEAQEPLSHWLRRAAAEGGPWTVLVAGGDLVVDGKIHVDGPLLLVAGGRLRVIGEVESAADELWLLGDGGGPGLPPWASRAPLVIDAPEANRLRAPLTFAVLTDPLPPLGGVTRWLDAGVVAEDRGGTLRVRYVPAGAELSGPPESWGAREHPGALRGAAALLVLVELSVDPPPADLEVPVPWRPPVVDEVYLVFERGKTGTR